MHPIVQRFRRDFAKHYHDSDQRLPAFTYIIESLAQLGRPVKIVETGCARTTDNWGGDGMSTLVWDWLVQQIGGTITSYDISEANVAVAREQVKSAIIVASDSVVALRGEGASPIDLLYLDSYDWNGVGSALHHLAELTAIYDRLPIGCLIAVDDNFGDEGGKGALVGALMGILGVRGVVDGYVRVWKKTEEEEPQKIWRRARAI